MTETEKVDGVCGTERQTCSAGKKGYLPDTPTEYLWKCKGLNGGEDVECSKEVPHISAINGVCGETNETCTIGIPNPAPHDTNTLYRWTCLGQHGGTDAHCTANRPHKKLPTAINASCGNRIEVCATGIFDPYPSDTSTKYIWTCKGSNGGRSVRCIAPKKSSTDGFCKKDSIGCLIGNYKDLEDTSTEYRWSCLGTRGGADTNCSKAKKTSTIKTNGICGSSKDTCTKGHYKDVTDSDDQYLWQCEGINGGSTKDCTEDKETSDDKINGVCGTEKETCTAGKYNPYPSDTDEQYRWICEGSNGGRHARCSKSKDNGGSAINGDCGSPKSCTAGTYVGVPADTPTLFRWTCMGINGGRSANCEEPKGSSGGNGGGNGGGGNRSGGNGGGANGVINGRCISGVKKEGCAAGTYVNVQETSDIHRWICKGINGGVDRGCMLLKEDDNGNWYRRMDGICGTPPREKCASGVYDDLSDTNTEYRWRCVGIKGGVTKSCSFPKNRANGICGNTKETCIAGKYKDKSDSNTYYLWSCLGVNGGKNTDCRQAKTTVKPTNLCRKELYRCQRGGGVQAVQLLPTKTHYRWLCQILGGNGETVTCTMPRGSGGEDPVNYCLPYKYGCIAPYTKGLSETATHWIWTCTDRDETYYSHCSLRKNPIPVNGQCGSSRNVCTKGKMVYPREWNEYYLWDCVGIDGGKNAECQIKK